MERKPDSQMLIRQIALGAGLGALVGVLLGLVAGSIFGTDIPWIAIGGGVGVPLGLGASYILTNRSRDN